MALREVCQGDMGRGDMTEDTARLFSIRRPTSFVPDLALYLSGDSKDVKKTQYIPTLASAQCYALELWKAVHYYQVYIMTRRTR